MYFYRNDSISSMVFELAVPFLLIAIISIILGIVILIWPHTLSYIIGIYLIAIGILYFTTGFI